MCCWTRVQGLQTNSSSNPEPVEGWLVEGWPALSLSKGCLLKNKQ